MTKDELYRNYMNAIDALGAMLEDYRSEGCADPNCGVCKRSKVAQEQAETAIVFARQHFAEIAK